MRQSRPRSVFTTPQAVSDQLVKADTGATQAITDEFNSYYGLVRDYCWQFSRVIETELNATFVPYYASKHIYMSEAIQSGQLTRAVYHYTLDLPDDMLALDSLTWLDTAVTSTYYRLVDEFDSTSGYPYYRLLIDPSGAQSLSLDFNSKITLAGEWGVQDNENDAYTDMTTLSTTVNDSITTLDIPDGQGANFAVFDYIRINDELMLITAIDSSGDPDVLTVTRGVNGFTAAEHDSGDTIQRWNIVDDVKLLATRMVAYFYSKRDDKGERVQVINDALVLAEFNKEIARIADRRKRSVWRVV